MTDVWFSTTRRVAVVALAGELDLSVADQVRRAMLRAHDAEALVVADLSGATFLDSTVAGVLVAAARRARTEGKQLVVAQAHGAPLRTLRLIGAGFLLTPAPPSEAGRPVARR